MRAYDYSDTYAHNACFLYKQPKVEMNGDDSYSR